MPLPADSMGVYVVNDNFYDANIYLVTGAGRRRRLGTVRSNSAEEYVLSWEPSEIYIVADFVGAGTARSDRLIVTQGDIIEIGIPPDAHSRPGVRLIRRD